MAAGARRRAELRDAAGSRSCSASTRTFAPIANSSRGESITGSALDIGMRSTCEVRRPDARRLRVACGRAAGAHVSEISDDSGSRGAARMGLCGRCYSRGYLLENGGRRFHLGVRLIQLGLNVVDRLELRSAARGPLERLVADTHDTALLVVPEQGRPPLRRQGDQRCARRAHRPADEHPGGRCTAQPRQGAARRASTTSRAGGRRRDGARAGDRILDRDRRRAALPTSRGRASVAYAARPAGGAHRGLVRRRARARPRRPPSRRSASRRSRTSSTRNGRDRAWPPPRSRSRGRWAGRATRPRSTYRWRAPTSARSGTGVAADMAERS